MEDVGKDESDDGDYAKGLDQGTPQSQYVQQHDHCQLIANHLWRTREGWKSAGNNLFNPKFYTLCDLSKVYE